MKRTKCFGTGRVAGFALAVGTLATMPAAIAQTYAQPYYDPVRDVMVTPRMSTTTTNTTTSTVAPRVGYGPSPVMSSPGAVGVTREPIYGTAPPTSREFYGSSYQPATTSSRVIPAPVPGIQSVPESSAGLEQPPTAGISPSPANVSGSGPAMTARSSSAAQPYYDPARDVMVTPSQSGTVRYTAAAPGQRVAMLSGANSSFDLVVRSGRLAQGPTSLAVEHGSEVTLVIDSDMADTLMIDGYNLRAPITPGQPMLLKFVAEQPGRFAYRLGSGGQIGVLEVGPPQPANRIGMR